MGKIVFCGYEWPFAFAICVLRVLLVVVFGCYDCG